MPYPGLCRNVISARSRSWPPPVGGFRCSKLHGHDGRCSERHFLDHLKGLGGLHKKIAAKIERDSFNTTGAAWNTGVAGPNRMPRHVANLPRDALNRALVANNYPTLDMLRNPEKITDKGASRDECLRVAIQLTREAYAMENAPEMPQELVDYFASISFRRTHEGRCLICHAPIDYNQFAEARVGTSTIQTVHSDPRVHTPGNASFGHKQCNVAQGDRTLEEYYDWMEEVLRSVGRI